MTSGEAGFATARAACEERRVAFWAYVFMPKHIHLLARSCREKYRISDFLYGVKKPFAERVVSAFKGESSAASRQTESCGKGEQATVSGRRAADTISISGH